MNNSLRPVGARILPLPIELGMKDASTPAFLQIASSISSAIAQGRLGKNQRLPSSRELAQQLGVHRNTVLAAYRELFAEDWIRSERGRGTFVSDALPAESRTQRPRQTKRRTMGYDLRARAPTALPRQLLKPDLIPLYGGLPDLRLIPNAALSRAYRRALRRPLDVLNYGDPRGHASLRTALRGLLREQRGLDVEDDGIVITRGSQMGLALSARALFKPGDLVAVEALGYQPAWEALRSAGARLVPVPVDDGGLDVDALGKLCERKPVRGVYLTPHHQYPTMVTLSAGRRLALLELARARRLVVLEDDYDHEFHYEGQPVLPLAARDDHGVVVYIGTLSKVLAPGLRTGYVAAAPELVERIVRLRYFLDRQGDLASERAVAELIDDGELGRHLRRTRRVYLERRNHCVSELRHKFGEQLEFQVPRGGMSLWLTVRGIAVEPWFERCQRAGVGFQPGGWFSWHKKSLPRIRLGYAAVETGTMSRALDLMWREFRSR